MAATEGFVSGDSPDCVCTRGFVHDEEATNLSNTTRGTGDNCQRVLEQTKTRDSNHWGLDPHTGFDHLDCSSLKLSTTFVIACSGELRG